MVDLAHTELLINLKKLEKKVPCASKGRKEIAEKLLKCGGRIARGAEGYGALSVLDPVRGVVRGWGRCNRLAVGSFEYFGNLN